MSNKMTLERFAAIIDAYGTSPARWPADERAAAEALLAEDPAAQALAAEAAKLDLMLAAARVEAPSAALVERLMAARPRAVAVAPAPLQDKGVFRRLIEALWPYGSPVVSTGALAASIMLGVALGSVSEVSVIGMSAASAASVEMETGERLVALALADTAWPEEWMQ
jgi:anti-sigma factor RsiW